MSSLLPTASGVFGDKPTLTFPTGPAPTGLEVVVLHDGEGPAVAAGDTVVVNYLGQVWGGAVFDSSYDRGETIAFPIGMGFVIAGWDEALVGQPIGSRLLLGVPAAKGYGDRGVPQVGIAGGDILVFVIDVVGVE